MVCEVLFFSIEDGVDGDGDTVVNPQTNRIGLHYTWMISLHPHSITRILYPYALESKKRFLDTDCIHYLYTFLRYQQYPLLNSDLRFYFVKYRLISHFYTGVVLHLYSSGPFSQF